MKRMGVYDQVKKALQDIMAPELLGLNAKIDGVNASLGARIDSVNASLGAKIDGLDAKVVSMKGELIAEIRRLDGRIDGLDRELRVAIDIRERLAALEARRPA